MKLIEKSQKNNGSTFSIYTDFPLKFSKELRSVFYGINVFFLRGEGMPKPSTRLSLSSNKMKNLMCLNEILGTMVQ